MIGLLGVAQTHLSTTEAAEVLGVIRQRVLQLISDGRIEAEKFANVYMIRRSSLEAVKDRPIGRPPKKKTSNKKSQ